MIDTDTPVLALRPWTGQVLNIRQYQLLIYLARQLLLQVAVLRPFLAFLRKSLAGVLCTSTVRPPNVKAPVVKSSMLNSLDLIRRVESFEENQA